MNQVVIQGPNGPKIKGTRVTIYDVYYYWTQGTPQLKIAEILSLTPEEVVAVITYIENHREDVHGVHVQIEGRFARGHPPETQAILDAIQAKYQALWAERKQAYPVEEDKDEGDSGGHKHPGSLESAVQLWSAAV